MTTKCRALELELPQTILIYLADTVAALDAAGVTYAIGGAVAMAAHGYTRATTDVDVFIDPNDRPAALRALRNNSYGASFRVERIHGDEHWIATRGDGGQKYRVDLLFPSADPDWSAIQVPDMVEGVPFFSPEMIALSKLYVNTYEAVTDIVVMLRSGIVDPTVARQTLTNMDPELLGAWAEIETIAATVRPARQRPAPKGKKS